MDNLKYNQFIELISTFERLKSKKEVISREELLVQFTNLTKDFGILKEKVYPKRYVETKRIIEENKHKIQFSTFELMEHNFRENTHSNILRYLFHYKYIKEGSKILSDFILKIIEDKEDKIICDILKNQYDIFREYHTGNGRIDLFIRDIKNKFIIVIENKIGADVGASELSEEGEITKTQLTNYQDYVDKNYKDYKALFILLSFKEVKEGTNTENFIVTNYDGLIEILNNEKSDDNILREYIKLLDSLRVHIDKKHKEYLIDLIADIKGTKMKEVSLSNLEIINTYYE